MQINQELDIERLIEDIEFSKEVGGHMNPFWCIPLTRLYQILQQYFPQIKEFTDAEFTTSNT